jgi:hypothetical protein
MMTIDEQKTEINRRSEEAMESYLRSRSWPEKIRSIERMRVADKIAKRTMREALEKGRLNCGEEARGSSARTPPCN